MQHLHILPQLILLVTRMVLEQPLQRNQHILVPDSTPLHVVWRKHVAGLREVASVIVV